MPDDVPIAKPVVKEPKVSSVPPAGRKFPCPSCGARLDYDPAGRGLACPYCGHIEKIERDESAEVSEREFDQYLDREEAGGKVVAGRSTETKCPGCGAIVLLEDKVATENCPFCGTFLENKPEAAHAMLPPESLLPFTVELRAARTAFEKWIANLWFAPTELRKVAALGQLTGVYLPYWTYDSMTISYYTGERGVDYTTTQTYTDRDANGNAVTRTRTVIHTSWSSVRGEVRHFFDDVLVCASKSIPADLIADLGEWALPKLEPFRAEYLSGFKTERYAVNLKEGFHRAKAIMEPEIIRLIRQDIGGDHQRISQKQTRHTAVTFKPLLLPMWVAVYRYQQRTYQILVNGRTARVTGYRPWSTMKIVRLVILILLGVGLLAWLIYTLNGQS